MENRYILNYDLKTKMPSGIRFKQGDVNTSVLEVTIFDDGIVADLTGEIIEFRFLKPDNTIVYQDYTSGVNIINATNGVIECVLKSNTLAKAGRVRCEIHRNKDDKELTTPGFNFVVEGSIGEDGILSTNYISSIESKLIEWQSDFNNIKNDYATTVNENRYAEIIAARKNEVDLGTKIANMDFLIDFAVKEILSLHTYGNISVQQYIDNRILRGDQNSPAYLELKERYLARGVDLDVQLGSEELLS